MAQWNFRAKEPGETIREPVQGEFFAAEAISDPGTALVREGIQNALDAGRDGEAVMVRIYLSDAQSSLSPENVEPYLMGAREHLQASNNGLRTNEVPTDDEPCRFLTFEDFGTTGLTGDTKQAHPLTNSEQNHFFNFFRAEGQTDKGAANRGSWGVGKHVFWRSSRISTVLAVTVRDDDKKKILMGKSMLKSHGVNGETWARYQEGYFGLAPNHSQPLVMPTDDETQIEGFCKLFDLQRGQGSGLSLVVLWPDKDITEQAIIRAVLSGYFYPILSGQLEVIIEAPGVKTILDADSLISEVEKMDADFIRQIKPLLELAQWARSVPDNEKHTLETPKPNCAWGWSDELFPSDVVKTLRESYPQGERLAVRVPVTVRKKNESPQQSHFDVFLVRDNSDESGRESGRPTFVRDGIIVPRVDAPRTRGVRALVVATDPAVAGFLRDSENPSHTEWQHDGSNFKGKYSSGKSDLIFIKRSVHEIARVLTEAEKEEDKILLADFFSLPAPPEAELEAKTKTKATPKPGGEPPEPEPDITPTPRSYRMEKTQGGFSILPAGNGAAPPSQLDIRMAYDIRRGNPLKKYNNADFDVRKSPIKIQSEKVEILEQADNRILIGVRDADFSLHVTGFDVNRDLYVRATRKEDREDADADPTV